MISRRSGFGYSLVIFVSQTLNTPTMADTEDRGEGSKAPKKDAKKGSTKKGEGSGAPEKVAKKPAPKKGKAKKDAEEGQESEGEGDVVASDEEEESLGDEFSGEEEEYDSDIGLLDFVVADSDVEEELSTLR